MVRGVVLRHKGHTNERPLNLGFYAHWRLSDRQWLYRSYGSGTGVKTWYSTRCTGHPTEIAAVIED